MKKLKLALVFVVCAAVLAAALSGCGKTSELNPGGLDNCLAVNMSERHQTMTGWGASSAWWSQTVPEDSAAAAALAEALYSDSGLGLNIYRYNIGGGSAELGAEEGVNYVQERKAYSLFDSSKYDEGKTLEENFADRSKYSVEGDKNAVEFLHTCLDQPGSSIEQVIVFVNSPHYLMTASGVTHGANEYDSNLPEENYKAFAAYVLNCILTLRADGIPVSVVSPINEPQHKWGGDGSTQEGCHYEPAEAAKVVDALYSAIEEFNATQQGLPLEVKISAVESGNYTSYLSKSRAVEYVYELSKYPWFDELYGLSVHAYEEPMSDSARKSYISRIENILGDSDFSVDMTEVCHMEGGVDAGMASGTYVAKIMQKDLSYLNARSWSWWIAASDYDYNDGLVYWDYYSASSELKYVKRYYAMAQYSKFVEPGDVRVGLEWLNASSAYGSDLCGTAFSRADGTVIVVLVNDTSSSFPVNIAGGYTNMTVTVTNENCDLKTEYEGAFRKNLVISPMSVTTIVMR